MEASAAARAILIMSRVAALSRKFTSQRPQPLLAKHLFIRPSGQKRRSAIGCLISGFDGGGVSDEFVSTRKSGFGREFTVIANMLKRIEPLDNSGISKGVSDSAKDSMKQTISAMLGLLPSDQFSVTVRISKEPLGRLIVSSIVTGYTLWNAEYRMSLMRNFDLSPDTPHRLDFEEENESREVRSEECQEILEKINLQIFDNLPPEVSKYIQQLELKLSEANQELHFQKEVNLQGEQIKKSNNNLLEYLRTLEPDVVSELSQPSSPEVDEIIHELARTTLRRILKNENRSDYEGYLALNSVRNYKEVDNKICDTFSTSRDYLAKLLFWCMLIGHHLRGLENRLHLSCAVGLL